MKKTCYNCIHFHNFNCADEADAPNYLIHHYCSKFNMVLKSDLESEINRFLDEQWLTMHKAASNRGCYLNNDFETGEAVCWMFEEALSRTPIWSDEEYEKHKKHNRNLAIKTLEYMLETETFINKYDGDTCNLNDYYDADEIKYFKDLLERLKKE